MNSPHSLPLPSLKSQPSQESDPASVVRDFIETVFNQGDLVQLQSFIDPTYRYNSPTEEMVGIDALRGFISVLRSAFPDMHVAVTDQIGDGPKVCTRVTLTGTQRGEFEGIPATGRPIKIEGVIISELADGCIAREWELLDQYAMLQQLGVLPEESAA